MTDEPIPSLAEALTEIRRLRAEVLRLQNELIRMMNTHTFDGLRERIAELEAAAAITFGTLEQPTPDWPTTIEHNIPPNAPPHDE